MFKKDTSWMRPKSVVIRSEYESEEEEEYSSEEEEEQEQEEEDNELNFERLFEERMKPIEEQLKDYATRFVYELNSEEFKKMHALMEEFKDLCGQHIPGSKELPIDSDLYKNLAKANGISFLNDEEKNGFLQGLQILENISFFQFLLLKNRTNILEKSCKRWTKERTDLEDSKLGALLLEEFYMPPQGREEKLDKALVQFSEMMTKRSIKIAEFNRKMRRADPNGVQHGVIARELEKFVNDHVEEIEKSKIYFSSAIHKLKVQQEQELVRLQKGKS
uniref:Uncharacterized protein n=1 Tax=Aplanochytrium stocchinoi TaxID=215587 RepID=A0A7S3PNQ4_9STRA|mmetsp:Transcript_3191/g.4046  ORF Transcript_3191/g.4046 Transcript_3191/m.4046 type:complete len:276 (+) Transcript_3191:368-1195(+)|eukprot:CAMPEP_0204841330 /NCGR_PEP_ID=MMETSP1346-20131115/41388_1 /ASSEMBLY_ACC=CAM_ASM_000771 /TAXON_ID=215587 /ORGANISM="Aplanochytrium stocchinoi, Strain GSBS06" /LENGTH=275 /DNA_ID=CAMNT_0051979365 /DNA_START=320 /DNA_END=1147 /DNA_ORIENTATION=+